MATYQKFQPFVDDVMEGVHAFASDAVTIALTNAANAPVVTNGVLLDLTIISYTNLSTRLIVTTSSTQTTGTYSLILVDHVLTASGGSVAAFRYVVIYNDTPTSAPVDPLVCFFDYGSDLTLADTETLTVDFNAGGLFTLV